MLVSVYVLHMIPVISIKSLSFPDFWRPPIFHFYSAWATLFLTVLSRSVMDLAILRVLSEGNCSSYLGGHFCTIWLLVHPATRDVTQGQPVYKLTNSVSLAWYKKLCPNKDEGNKVGWSESVSQDFEGERKSESGNSQREQDGWGL